LDHQGARYSLGVGFFQGGKPGEIFLSGAKVGSDTAGLLADLGVVLSRALQHGDTVGALAAGMGRLGDGKTPASIPGAVLDRLAAPKPETSESQGD
jgi:hypothetical protein